MTLLKILTRILAIEGKELVSVMRRPGALISLVLGPFLIMALFGAGYSGFRRPLETIVVIPEGSGLHLQRWRHLDDFRSSDASILPRSREIPGAALRRR